MKYCDSKIDEEDDKYGIDESYSRKDTNGSEKWKFHSKRESRDWAKLKAYRK